MLTETKIYSDFIKRNDISVLDGYFIHDGMAVPLSKDDDGKWYAGNDDKCYTKKAAVYFYCQTHFNVVNGIIQL